MPYKLLDRFKEPSTWAAVGAALGALGVNVPDWSSVANAGMGVAVLLAVLLKEGK